MPTVKIQYQPHKGQLAFHLDRYKVRNRGLIGGGGTGKTEAGASEAIGWSFENPGCVGSIFAPTYKMLKRFTIPKLQKLLGVTTLEHSPFILNYQKTDMKIELRTYTLTGELRPSTIWMVGVDNPESAEGMNLDWAWMDEARLIPKFEEARQSVQRRLRGSTLGVPLDEHVPSNVQGFWVTTTPDGPGSELHNFFENPHTRNTESKVYRMSLYDNQKNLPSEFVKEMEQTHTGGLFERFVMGRFATVTLGAFEFDYAVHVEGFNQYYNKENIRAIIAGVDFGWTNPACILPIAVDGDGRAYVLDEFYKSQTSEEQLTKEAIAFIEEYGRGRFFCDSSEPRTINEFRKSKIQAYPNKTKRDDGIREVGGRFKLAGDGRPRLYISPKCVNLIAELQTYDPDKKVNDHATDALRYGLMGYSPPKQIQASTAKVKK